MNPHRTLARWKSRTAFSLLISSLVVCSATIEVWAFDTEVDGLVYHAQVTSYYCGSATVEMMLDNDAVRTNNPYLDWVFNNAPDPAPASFYNQITGQDATFGTIGFNALNNVAQSIHPTYANQIIAGVNGGNPISAVTYGPQLAIYDLAHGAGTYTPVAGPNAGTPLGYFNPFQPWGAGSGINGQQFELNVFDNPNVGGEGSHAFTAYNVASLNVANRTIANAIINYDVPAGGVFYAGAHAMAITGVETDVPPVGNPGYKITGFFVDDPWNIYAISRGLPPNQWGLDPHELISNVPKGAGPSKWQKIFTLSPGEPGEGAYASGIGYKFVVEPQGPEPLDDGTNFSTPDPVPLLANPLDATDATMLAPQLVTDNGLSAKYGLSGGGFDAANVTLIDPAGESDWLVPYSRGGDYTGGLLISSKYGILDEAFWNDAGDLTFNLADLVAEYEAVDQGWHPVDNPVNVPEISTLALAEIGIVLCGLKRRQPQNCPAS
ncbi:MAG TPA: hypothetical protein VHE81_15805 [Lacipirellulaceae bacterium]|nr:hypothetical protein [Lacipirellulaceae bacterium]